MNDLDIQPCGFPHHGRLIGELPPDYSILEFCLYLLNTMILSDQVGLVPAYLVPMSFPTKLPVSWIPPCTLLSLGNDAFDKELFPQITLARINLLQSLVTCMSCHATHSIGSAWPAE